MTPAVISVPRAHRRLARFLPGAAHDVITAADRSYLIFVVARRDYDLSFIDPIDGELLIECRYFDDEPAARRWIAADIALRGARTGSVQ